MAINGLRALSPGAITRITAWRSSKRRPFIAPAAMADVAASLENRLNVAHVIGRRSRLGRKPSADKPQKRVEIVASYLIALKIALILPGISYVKGTPTSMSRNSESKGCFQKPMRDQEEMELGLHSVGIHGYQLVFR